MNTRYLKRINQLLQKINLEDLAPMDGSSSALSLGMIDGSIILSDSRQIVIIKKLVVNINSAQGGGATINIRT